MHGQQNIKISVVYMSTTKWNSASYHSR